MTSDALPLGTLVTPAHVLYRIFDRADRLLYIGITLEFGARMKNHAKHRGWWHDAARITLEHYPSRREVEEAERQAIIDESPIWNVTYSRPAAEERTRAREARAALIADRRSAPSGEVRSRNGVPIGVAAEQLKMSRATVRTYAQHGLLHVASHTAGGHARFDRSSIDELAEVLAMPPGEDRDAAMSELRDRNQGHSNPGDPK